MFIFVFADSRFLWLRQKQSVHGQHLTTNTYSTYLHYKEPNLCAVPIFIMGHRTGGSRSQFGPSVFRDITNQSIYGDSIKKRLYNSTKGKLNWWRKMLRCEKDRIHINDKPIYAKNLKTSSSSTELYWNFLCLVGLWKDFSREGEYYSCKICLYQVPTVVVNCLGIQWFKCCIHIMLCVPV